MDDSLGRSNVKVRIGDKELTLHYNMASIYWLTHEYKKDIREIFSAFTDSSPMDDNFMKLICDVVYAGLYEPGDDGADTSGWSPFGILKIISFDDIPDVMKAVAKAIEASQPKAAKNVPTRAPSKKGAEKAGTGTTSIPQEGQS